MRPRRISRFQFAVTIAVTVVTVFGWASLRDLRERLERAQVEADVRNLNSALQIELAHRIETGREAEIAQLAGSNPVRWLAAPMTGYLGEAPVLPPDPAPRSWYFDRSRGELVYRPALSAHLSGAGSPPLLRWRVQAPRPDGRPALTGGLVVAVVSEYRWY